LRDTGADHLNCARAEVSFAAMVLGANAEPCGDRPCPSDFVTAAWTPLCRGLLGNVTDTPAGHGRFRADGKYMSCEGHVSWACAHLLDILETTSSPT